MTSSTDKLWAAADKAKQLIKHSERQQELFRQLRDTYALRAAYDLPLEGAYGFCIIDESFPRRSQVDSNGYGRGKYGGDRGKHQTGRNNNINCIRGVVHIYKDQARPPLIEDDLLEFHRKTRGVFLRG